MKKSTKLLVSEAGLSMPDDVQRQRSFCRLAWIVLFSNLAIILWGALVRATGSGAGCGEHWPLCNGEVLPTITSAHRAIEFTHRATVGVVALLVLGMTVRARREFPRGNPARTAAGYSLFFTFVEALIGAVLVRYGLVAKDTSSGRAFVASAHLVNTFLLVASLALTAWWAGGAPKVRLAGQGAVAWLVGAALLSALLVGATGAIAALGETLFPAGSREEIGKQVAANAHFLRQLRIYHPFIAVFAGGLSVGAAWFVASLRPDLRTKSAAYWVTVLVAVQIGVGFLNLFMLAPLYMQLIHLLLADALWICLVFLAASALAEGAPRAVRYRSNTLSAESTQ